MSEKLEFTGLDIDTDSPECIAERERLGKKIANLISDGWIPPWDRHLYWFIGWSNENDKVDYIELCMLGGEKIKFVPQPKPTEGRLLSKEEMDKVPFDMGSPWGLVDRYTVGIAIAKAQRDLTASILEPQCQARVGRIFKEIEKHRVCDPVTGELKGYWLSPEEIEALKKGVLPK